MLNSTSSKVNLRSSHVDCEKLIITSKLRHVISNSPAISERGSSVTGHCSNHSIVYLIKCECRS